MMNFNLFLEGMAKSDNGEFLKRAQIDSFDKNVRNGKKRATRAKFSSYI